MKHIGEKIKQRRKMLNLSQDELAKRMGYKSRSSINKIELGQTDVTRTKIMEFAKLLETTPAYLIDLENNDNYYGNITKTSKHLEDKPDLLEIYNNIISNDNLVLLFDNVKDLDPEDMEVILRVVKGIKSEKNND